MKRTLLIFVYLFLVFTATVVCAQSVSNPSNTPKMKFLIHVTQSTENPTVAALAFLVAKTALEEGHSVSIFLAGDAVKLLQESTLNTLTGLGTGKLREHYDAIVKQNGRFYLSGNSSKARGVTEEDLKGKPAEFALPTVLVKLATESDRVFTY
ncbi:DsrE family protein [Dyadobacter arcticus]|uniref:Peroxiredoxin n=1 Tax=Dyadobacter arcticus TaxID=1078754 RepID=A0ABX0ULD9_9BACT|nr:DsrE family protein [Dyadobacter arcticus]NIJ53822.1 putative peroxiredoxin [Dyadobacter arcticus]